MFRILKFRKLNFFYFSGNFLKKDTTYRVGDDKIRLQEIILVIGQAEGKGGR